MVKVIQREELRRKRTTCLNCSAILEYEHGDTYHDCYYDPGLKLDIHSSFITCPECRYKLKVREWATDCL